MAIDWTIPRLGVYRFFRVEQATRRELEPLTTIPPGGSISRNLNTALKEQGALPCVELPALGDDLVRIYYHVEDDAGGRETLALATMYAVKAAGRFTAAAESATLTLMSALLPLDQAKLRTTLTIPAGSVAITEAVAICQAAGLPVVASASTKQLTGNASWSAGDSLLKVVNWLSAFAGFWSAGVDGWGRVVLAPYEDPGCRQPVWSFVDGANCTYVPDVSVATDAYDVPNVCVLTCSNPAVTFSGSYTNDDPASPFSTVSRGREITLPETVDDAASAADLAARAQQRLLAATAATETLTLEHSYAPVTIGDVIDFAWAKHELAMRAAIQSQDLILSPALPTKTTSKRVWA